MKYAALLLGFIGLHVSQEYLEVEVEQGTLRGEVLASKAGGNYISFKGIPYAKPPVGEHRFVDANPPEPWDGIRYALKEGNKCAQFDIETQEYTGDEDCLYLNVYTPYLSERVENKTLLPVMFWIHGGGFMFGSGDSYIYGPDYLVSENVALVTFNYRIGPFGFLFMREAAPGNAGLKDQVAALRWVQKNIHAFGGNPNSVTISGESSGGSSVHLHMLSPITKGLFHRAVSQSGTAVNPWAFQHNPEEKTRRLGNALGCDQEEPQALVECLREKHHMAIIKATHNDVPSEADRARLVNFIFVPCLEYTVPEVEKFLVGSPENWTIEGRYHEVPYLAGANSQEGLIIWAGGILDFKNETVLSYLDSKWDENVWSELRTSPDNPTKAAGLHAIRNFYLDGRPLTRDLLQQYLNMFSDLEILEGLSFTLRYMARHLKAPLYVYNFNVDNELNFLKATFNISWPGAAHTDELGYIFDVKRLPEVAGDSTAAIARRRMVRLLTNFVKYGNPTPYDDPLLEVNWKQFTKRRNNYLYIDSNLTVLIDLNKDRVNFWEEFYWHYS